MFMYFSIISSPSTVHSVPRGCAANEVTAAIFAAMNSSVGEIICDPR